MPDSPERPVSWTLANGLTVATLSLPAAPCAAAVLRVAAGSHDEPAEYPGLAHFLEHLLFLGGAEYPAADGLMPFVQSCGGQLNASTRERDSYFFFEVPASALEAGLARLCDMAARPLLDTAAQLREREVLHAEFLARAQDTDTLCDAALAEVWAVDHPALRFHAGRRDSLPVELPAFQRALRAFHRRGYQASRACLVLVGPQPSAELRQLAQRYGGVLPDAAPVARSAPPSLLPVLDAGVCVQVPGVARLSLYFALEAMPAGFAEALEFFGFALGAGDLPGRLRELDWCDEVRLRVPYRYAGQALVAVEFDLRESARQRQAEIAAAFFAWLDMLRGSYDWSPWWRAYERSSGWQRRALEPLGLARHWAERLPPMAQPGSTADTLTALRALFAQLQPQCMVPLMTAEQVSAAPSGSGFPVRARREAFALAPPGQFPEWCRVPSNPFLQQPAPPAITDSNPGDALRWLPETGEVAVLYLRWRFTESPAVGVWRGVNAALAELRHAARQAAVEFVFEELGDTWQLRLSGPPEPQVAVLMALSEVLVRPPARVWASARPAAGGPLIHRLWQALPALLADAPPASSAQLGDWQALLDRLWATACWDGLALGHARSRLEPCLARMPGRPDLALGRAAGTQAGYYWRDVGIADAQSAVLLFCPVPAPDAQTEAAWRLLAQLHDAAFYRRLRSELQLGYAVFSGFRQLGAIPGLLFAVQSPQAAAGEILGHIEEFLAERQTAFDFADLREQGRALAARLERPGGLRERGEQAWQEHLAGRSADHRAQLCQALRRCEPALVQAAHRDLRNARGGWWVLANAAPVDGRWQPR